MNKLFRIVWSAVRGAFIVAHEKANSHGKPSSTRRGVATALMTSLLAGSGLVFAAPPVNTLPTGGQIVGGAATGTIATNGNAMTVNQNQPRMVANWDTYSIGQNASVHYQQPTGGVALNRVTGSQPSEIYGKLTATGDVYLINANGILFGRTAQVDVGALVASTSNISDADFLAGKAKFVRNGATGKIENEGQLTAALGGYIALLAPEVRNSGIILAQMGTVALAAGDAVELQFDSGKLANVRVDPATIATLIENKNAVQAPGGLIILSAQAASKLQSAAIKNSGTLDASSLTMKGGRIVLEASSSVENTGSISAAGNANQAGGQVEITAPQVVQNGSIDVSGSIGGSVQIKASDSFTLGGQILAKGLAGAGGTIRLQQAQTLTLQTGSKLDASGTTQGGSVYVESANSLKVAGTIDASSANGAGGNISLAAGTEITLNNATLDASGASHGGTIKLSASTATHISLADPANPINDPMAPPQDRPKVAVTGTSVLRSSSRRGKGGDLQITGDDILLGSGSLLEATGETGGGTALVGGDWQGSGAMQQAITVNMENGAKIDVSATKNGDGGKVVLWSDVNHDGGVTRADGEIQAKGGVDGGDGGKVEISGHGLQLGENLRVNTQAPTGSAGLLLLDPKNIIISNSNPGGAADISSYSTSNGQLWNELAYVGTDANVSVWTTPTSIVNLLNANIVYLQAANDITIGSAINASGNSLNSSLTMWAGRSILINADITLRGAFSATANYYTIAQQSQRDAGAGNFTMAAGTTISTNGGGAASVAKSIDITVSKTGETAGAASIASLIAGSATGASKDITILADNITLVGAANSIQGSGTVTLAPLTASRAVQAGGTDPGNALFFSSAALASLKAGFSAINIGDNTGGTRDNPDVSLTGTTTVAGSLTFTSPVNFFGGAFTQNSGTTITAPGVGIYADTMALNGGANSITSTGYAAFGPGTFTKTSVIGATGTTGQWWFDATKLSTVQSVLTSGYTGLTLGAPAQFTLADSGSTSLAGTLATTAPLTIIGRDVTVDAAYSWSDASTLTLNSSRNITINAAITASNSSGKLALYYGQGGTAVNVANDPNTYGSYSLGSSGKVNLQAGQNFDTKAGYDGTVKNWQVITSLGAAADATSGSAMTLQGMARSANLATSFVLGGNIDASATSGWNSGAGWTPIGTQSTPFSGNFDGFGHTITGLTINTTNPYSGLFGYTNATALGNVGLISASITGTEFLGALAGHIGAWANVNRVYATGSVTGSGKYAGGLFGRVSGGTLTNSYTDMTVTQSAGYNSVITGIGGLIGSSSSPLTINDSYARGNVVSGQNGTGGLIGVGEQAVTINRAYMLGNVGKFTDANGTPDSTALGSDVGGLIGQAIGQVNITESYNKGHVAGLLNVGGLLGRHGSFGNISITRSYTTGNVRTSASGQRAGGLIAYADGSITLTDNYTTGIIRAEQADAGGLVAFTAGAITFNGGNYVAGYVYSPGVYGGVLLKVGAYFSQANAGFTINGAVTAFNWEGGFYRMAQPYAANNWDNFHAANYGTKALVGQSLTQMQTQDYYLQGAGKFDFTNTWAITPGINNGMPYLRANVPLTFVTITLPSYTMTYGNTVPTITSAWSATGGTSYISGLTWGSTIGATPNVGTYTYGTDSNLFSIAYASGSAASYSISYSSNSLTVDPRPINITAASGQTKVYGATNPTYTYTAEAAGSSRGLVGSDTFTGALARVAGENVGTYAVNSVGTLANSNYAITVVPANFSITAAPLTVTASAQSKTYGSTLSLGTSAFTASGLQNSETIGSVTLAASGGTAATDNAGSYTITPSAASSGTFIASNYNITYSTGTLTVNPALITLTAGNQSKTYGSTLNLGTTAYSITAGSLKNSDTISGLTLTSAGALDTANVAGSPYAIAPSAASGTGGFNTTNYTISYGNGTLTVNKAPLTVTASNDSKTYNAVAYSGGNGVTYSGFVLSENASALSGSLLYTTGSSNGAVNAGTYTIRPSGYLSTNYSYTYVDGTLTINKASLTITGAAINNRAYTGGNAATFSSYGTLSGTFYGSDSSNVSINAGGTSATFDSLNAANGIGVTAVYSVTGSAAGNYLVTTPTGLTANITPKTLTVSSLAASNKVYDGNAVATLSNWGSVTTGVGAETLVLNHGTASFSDKNAANGKTVTAIGYALADGSGLASNYQLSSTSATTTANIAAKTVTLSAAKTYDGTTSLAGFVTLGGFIGSETLNYTGASASNSHVASAGKYINAITLTDGSGGGLAGNYQLPTLNAANAPLSISAASLTPTLSNTGVTKVYDGDTSTAITPTYTFAGLVAGDTGAALSNTGKLYNSKDVATGDHVTVSGLAISGVTGSNSSAASDYALSTSSLNVTASITRKDVSVTFIQVADKVYDGTTNATSVVSTVLSGVIAADSVNVNSSGTLAGFSGKDVGSYSISVTGMSLTGSAIGNYNLTSSIATDSSVAITPKTVTLSAAKTYDGTTSLTGFVTLGGFIGSETLNYTGASASNSHVATANKYISAITLTNGSGGGLAGNYQLPILNAANAPLTISAATLTPTLTNTGVTKAYDGSTSSSLTPAWSFSGLVSGDTTATLGYTGRNYNSQDVLVANTVTVSGLSISGITSGNSSAASDYVLDATSKTVAATITPKTLTVSGLAASNKIYDATTDVSISNWGNVTTGVGSETLVLNHGTASFSDKNKANGKTVTAIDYALANGGNGGLASNYQLSSTSATTTANITAKSVTLGGSTGVTKTYDGRTAMPVGSNGYENLVGIVSGDSVAITGAPVFDSANAGSRTVLLGSVGIAGTDAGNYALSWSNGSGTINKAPLTVSANADAKFVTQGDATGTYNSVSYGGFVNGENTSVLNIAGLAINRNNASENNAGTYAGVLVASGVTAGNYAITYVNGTYTIVPAGQLLVRVQNNSTTYGTAASYSIVDARYMDGSNVIHTLAAPTQSGNTFTYGDGVGGNAIFTLGPVSPQTSTAGQLKAGLYSIDANNIAETSSNFSNTLTVIGGLTVTQKALTANASNVTKVYDGSTDMNNVVLGYTGLETNDVVTIAGNGNFSDKNVGSGKAYTVTSLALGSQDAANYYLAGGDSFAGSNGAVTQKTVTLTASRVYDGTRNLDGSALSIATGVGTETLTFSGATANSKNVGAGNYVDAITLLDGTNGGVVSNYQLPSLASTNANNVVSFTPKVLSISGITAADKTYDGNSTATVSTAGITATVLQAGGLVIGDDLTVSTTGNFRNAGNAANDKNVGNGKTVLLASSYGGADVGNYTITDQATTTASITPKTLTLASLAAADKTYDGTISATLTLGSLLGLVGSETLALNGVGTFSDPNVGIGKTVLAHLALADSSGLASNYTISDATTTATIKAVPNPVPPLPPNIPGKPTPPPNVPDPIPPLDPNSSSSSGGSSSGGSSSGSGSSSGGDASSSSGSGSSSSGSSSSGGSSSGSGSSSGGDASSGSGSSSSSSGGSSSGSGSSSGGDASSGSGSGSSSSGGSSSGSGSSSGGDASSGSGSSSSGSSSSSSGGSSSGSGSSSGGDASSGSGSGSSSSGGSSSGSGSSSGGDASSGSGSSSSSSGGSSSGSSSSSGGDASSSSGSGSSSSGGSSSGSGSSSGGDASSSSGSGSSSSGGSSSGSGSGSSSGGDASSSSGSGSSSSGGSSSGSGSGSGSSSGGDNSGGSGSGGNGSDTGSGLISNGSTTSRSSSEGEGSGREQITVTVLKQPTDAVTGAILVEVPGAIVRAAAGFSFQLPKDLIELAATIRSQPEATLVNGDPLPPWLRFVPTNNMFVAKNVPSGGLPVQVVIKIGRTRTVLLVTERNS
ncbi:MAG: hypothetical protein CVU16_07565 [Betaproteobacteria bacterium HGW-Betaproteobacteria-10]|nr:MAG: hypothetical protein CVU16_07565 [Betaproteobacteria bacterium HGW-Betaproteobacteria-10]